MKKSNSTKKRSVTFAEDSLSQELSSSGGSNNEGDDDLTDFMELSETGGPFQRTKSKLNVHLTEEDSDDKLNKNYNNADPKSSAIQENTFTDEEFNSEESEIEEIPAAKVQSDDSGRDMTVIKEVSEAESKIDDHNPKSSNTSNSEEDSEESNRNAEAKFRQSSYSMKKISTTKIPLYRKPSYSKGLAYLNPHQKAVSSSSSSSSSTISSGTNAKDTSSSDHSDQYNRHLVESYSADVSSPNEEFVNLVKRKVLNPRNYEINSFQRARTRDLKLFRKLENQKYSEVVKNRNQAAEQKSIASKESFYHSLTPSSIALRKQKAKNWLNNNFMSTNKYLNSVYIKGEQQENSNKNGGQLSLLKRTENKVAAAAVGVRPKSPPRKKLLDPQKTEKIMKSLLKKKWYGIVANYAASNTQSKVEEVTTVEKGTEAGAGIKESNVKAKSNSKISEIEKQQANIPSKEIPAVAVVRPTYKKTTLPKVPVKNVATSLKLSSTQKNLPKKPELLSENTEPRLSLIQSPLTFNEASRKFSTKTKTAVVPNLPKFPSKGKTQVHFKASRPARGGNCGIPRTGILKFHQCAKESTKPNFKSDELSPSLTKLNQIKLTHRPFKISPKELVDAISDYQMFKNPKEQTTTTAAAAPKNKIGISTILNQSNHIKAALLSKINDQSPMSAVPMTASSRHNVKSSLKKNLTANATTDLLIKKGPEGIIKKGVEQQRAGLIFSKLPAPQIPTIQQPLEFRRRKPTPNYAKKPKRPTFSALKSSRPIKPIPVNKLPTNLKYGNFTHWLWPTVLERFPSSVEK